MAISPNVDFVSGAILTAAQQNQFPRGIVALGTATANDTFTAEEIEVTSTSFTAVANRYYKITYYEPDLSASAIGYNTMTVRLTNLAGAVQTFSYNQNTAAGLQNPWTVSVVKTLTAGSTTLVATLQTNNGTGTANRDATRGAYLLVEDLGPA